MPFTVLPVSLALAAACALINMWLTVRVGRSRWRERVSLGDGGSDSLARRMRAQANLVENAPFVLALVVLIELATPPSGAPHSWLAAAAALFVVARLAHPFGMDGVGPARMVGAGLTMLVQLMLAIWAVVIVAGALDHPRRAAPVEATVPRG